MHMFYPGRLTEPLSEQRNLEIFTHLLAKCCGKIVNITLVVCELFIFVKTLSHEISLR